MSEYPPGSKKKSSEKEGFTPEKVVSRLERDYLALAEKLRKKNIQPEELSPEMWESANGILEEARAVVAEYNKTKNIKRKISLFRELQGLGKSLKNAERNLLKNAEISARIHREADPVESQVEPVESTAPDSVLDVDFSDPNANSLPDLELSGDDSTPLDLDLSADNTTSLDLKLSDDTMKHFDIDLSQPGESTPSQSTGPREMRINPDDVPEYIKEDLASREDTRAGWYSRMRELVGKVTEKTKEKVRDYASSSEGLIRRNAELDAQLEKVSGVERGFRWLGEKYNKMPLKYKLALGATFGLGTALTAGSLAVALPLLGIGAQRVAGLATMYMKFEKNSHQEKWGKEKAMLKAGAYTVLLGLAMKEAIQYASQTELAHSAQAKVEAKVEAWLGSVLGYESQPKAGAPMRQIVNPKFTPQTETPPSQPPRGIMGDARAIDLEKAPAVSDVPRPTTPTTANIVEKIVDKVPKIPSEKIGFYDPSGEQQRLTDLQFVQKDIDAPESAPSDTLVPPSGEGSGTTSAQADIVEGPNNHITPDVRERAEAWVASKNPETAPASAPSAEPVLGKPEAPVPQAPEPAPTPVETGTSSPGSASDFINQETQPAAPVEDRIPKIVEHPTTESPADTNTDASINPEQATSAQSTPETPVLENFPAEHLREFVNENNISVDPLHGHIFESTGGKVFAYGNDFSARYDTALDYAIAHPNTSVFVQAEKPALDLATGKLNLWVHEIKYERGLFGIGGGIKILNPIGPTSPDQIISVNPDTFTKQLDK